MNQYLEIIKKQQIMNDELLQYLQYKEYKKGEYILKQGQTLEYLYILVKGRTKVCHTTVNGNTLLCSFTKALSVIGEVEFFQHKDVVSDIYALEDCHCFLISIYEYQQMILNDLSLMKYLAYTATYKLYRSNMNASISNNYPVENRLASYLISCEYHGMIQENFVNVAMMIGCSYRQLQRTLNEFCMNGYIMKLNRGEYEIIDCDALKQLGQDLYQI